MNLLPGMDVSAGSTLSYAVNTLLVIFGYLLFKGVRSFLSTVWNFFFPRPGSYPERYPLENTVVLISNQQRVLDLTYEKSQEVFEKTGKKTFIMKTLGLAPFVFSNDVENITYVLKTNFENFGKSGEAFKSKFQGLLGDGIFNADGAQWFAHRKTSAHLFKFNRFKTTVLEVFNTDLSVMIQVIRKKAGAAFDIHALLHRFTLDSISRIAFGVELDCIRKDNVSFADDFDYCTACIDNSFVNPLWRFERYFTPGGWKYFWCLYRLNRYAYKMISERRKEFAANSASKEKRNDLLSLYLDSDNFATSEESSSKKSVDSISSSGSSSGKYSAHMEPTDANLRDVILNMIIAGRDTTAQALSWTFYRLCIHPEEQAKVREEVRAVLGNSNGSSSDNNGGESELDALVAGEGVGAIGMKALQELRYTEAVCNEVLRLHPSVPKEGKCVLQDDVLPDGTVVKRGDIFSFQAYAMGRDTSLWGKDASEFKPQRFIDNPKPSPFVFTAFQAGPRTCLGQNFAILEMKCTLARLLLAFEFKLEQDPATVTYANSLTLPIKGGLRVSAKSLLQL